MYPDVELTTKDGYDLQFGTNVLGDCETLRIFTTFADIAMHTLGHFYLTRLLIPLLLQTASSSPDGKVRVVNTSSMGHMGADCIDYETLKDGPKRRKKGSMWLYSQSKFVSNIYYVFFLRSKKGT